jgi:hypothetical protein
MTGGFPIRDGEQLVATAIIAIRRFVPVDRRSQTRPIGRAIRERGTIHPPHIADKMPADDPIGHQSGGVLRVAGCDGHQRAQREGSRFPEVSYFHWVFLYLGELGGGCSNYSTGRGQAIPSMAVHRSCLEFEMARLVRLPVKNILVSTLNAPLIPGTGHFSAGRN